MPIISAPHQYHADDVYVDLRPIFGQRLFLKCEGFNFAGSIKLKAAVEMVTEAERQGVLVPGSTLVESSSGNLGVALSMIAASRGYEFICVTDTRCGTTARRMMEALGARVHVVTTPDRDSGLLGARISYIRGLCASNLRYVWLNQYTNPSNWKAHYRCTAPAISRQFPNLDVLFVGAGTTGTLMGCARYFREQPMPVTVVAVDAVVRVTEPETIRVCHQLAERGFLFGGSTGSVVSGALGWLAEHRPDGGACAVAIAPDLGERYLDSVYQNSWLRDHYELELRR